MGSGRCCVHLPGVRLADDGPQPFAHGSLECLTFDRWRHLDDVLADEGRNYERSAPVFYHQVVEVDDVPSRGAVGDVIESFAAISHMVHAALTIATGGIFPHPGFSVTYHDLWPGRMTPTRTIGPFERESIVFGHRHGQTSLSTGHIEQANAVYEQLLRHPDRSYPELWWAIASLELTSRPEFSALQRFVHSVNAIESLLVPGTSAKKRTFTDRTAALLAGSDDIEAVRDFCALVYKVRSGLLHGDDYRKWLDRYGISEEDHFEGGRPLLAAVIRGLLIRLDETPASDGAWARVVAGLDWDEPRANLEAPTQ